jgi:3-hydroxyisobutyrate dehydrogenase-like beta-hydroxyacid dehydrogenase
LEENGHTIGWLGTGRMGAEMAGRLLRSGHRLMVYNRTRSKLEPLLAAGAVSAQRPADLARCDVVFVTVASSDDLLEVLGGEDGLLGGEPATRVVVDCSTVSAGASAVARELAAARNVAVLAAPVSGNPKVVRARRLTMAVSGPRDAFELAEPYLRAIGSGATWVGEGEASRLVKLCHNLFLGVVIQSLIEVTLLAEKGGVHRRDFLAFINDSVLGSPFTRYKSPALVNLDFVPTFTTRLLRKDLELGLDEARRLEVPMNAGIGEEDFAALIALEAAGAGLQLTSEHAEVPDGLSGEPPQEA